MKIVKVAPLDGGKRTELTVSMTAQEVHLFYQALADGKLAGLGITDAKLVNDDAPPAEAERWTKGERDKRSKPKSGPDLP